MNALLTLCAGAVGLLIFAAIITGIAWVAGLLEAEREILEANE